MRNVAATVTAVFALLLAAAAFATSMGVLTRPQPKPAPQQPLGVCVLINSNFADTTVIADVAQATRVNGVVTCEAGMYVPVRPK